MLCVPAPTTSRPPPMTPYVPPAPVPAIIWAESRYIHNSSVAHPGPPDVSIAGLSPVASAPAPDVAALIDAGDDRKNKTSAPHAYDAAAKTADAMRKHRFITALLFERKKKKPWILCSSAQMRDWRGLPIRSCAIAFPRRLYADSSLPLFIANTVRRSPPRRPAASNPMCQRVDASVLDGGCRAVRPATGSAAFDVSYAARKPGSLEQDYHDHYPQSSPNPFICGAGPTP